MSPDWPFIKPARHQVAERKLAVEHLARVDAAVEDPRNRRLEVGADCWMRRSL